ncbi:MAG: HAD-IB family phosphatase, partial [Methanobrevibacter sp.]|nr:HAD-IB family phosphatase [Candidatus Methanovirga basalitermitum]
MKDLIFVFDVDSTVITFESLNKIISQNINDKKKSKKLDEIANKALNGEYDYHKAFILRFYLTNLIKENFVDENRYIKNNLVEKIKDVFNLLFKEKCEVYLLSGGFKINIDYVAKLLKISNKNVFANDFIEKDGKLVLNDSPLTYVDGKIDACKEIKKRYKNPFLTMIGDGVTDMNV